jgi:hypothetical protein
MHSDDPIYREIAPLVKRVRDELSDSVVAKLHLHEADEGTLGGRKFTRNAERYFDHPPKFVQELRKRKYPKGKRDGPERLGYRVVWAVVVMREPLNLCCERLSLGQRQALVIIGSELRAILNAEERHG